MTKCNFCERKAIYINGLTTMGVKANMCNVCFVEYGMIKQNNYITKRRH